MIEFVSKEKDLLAAITGLAPIQVDKLLTMGIINKRKALDAIIAYDCKPNSIINF